MSEKKTNVEDKKIVEKQLYCIACKKESKHKVRKISYGTSTFPIFEYRSVCSNCGTIRRLPKEPK